MSLPYGPLVRGMTPSWIYDRIRSELAKLRNAKGALIYDGAPRTIGIECLDQRELVRPDFPYAIITLEQGSSMRNSRVQGIPETIYEPGEIAHEGTGTDQVQLTGSHQGNNKFTVEITASGTVGTDGSYELRKTPWTGQDWGTEVVVSSGAIPASGKITVGNGQTFELTLGQAVVLNDTYSWETGAYKISNVNSRTVKQRARADIALAFPDEAALADGYLDQIYLLFNHPLHAVEVFTGHAVAVEEEMIGLGVRRIIERVKDEDADSVREVVVGMMISVNLEYRGQAESPVVFTADVQPFMRPEIEEVEIKD